MREFLLNMMSWLKRGYAPHEIITFFAEFDPQYAARLRTAYLLCFEEILTAIQNLEIPDQKNTEEPTPDHT